MTEQSLTCIVCPMGCRMSAVADGNSLVSLRDNACKRGESYAVQELFDPRRTLTTTVSVSGGTARLVAVKTAAPIPKAMLSSCMEVLRRLRVAAPVRIGDVLLGDILSTGVPVTACSDVEAVLGKE